MTLLAVLSGLSAKILKGLNATLTNNAKAVRLHFEYLGCQSDQDFRVGDTCLRKEFVAFGPHNRLAKT